MMSTEGCGLTPALILVTFAKCGLACGLGLFSTINIAAFFSSLFHDVFIKCKAYKPERSSGVRLAAFAALFVVCFDVPVHECRTAAMTLQILDGIQDSRIFFIVAPKYSYTVQGTDSKAHPTAKPEIFVACKFSLATNVMCT